MSITPNPHSIVLPGSLGVHDQHAEDIARAAVERQSRILRRSRRLDRWSRRIGGVSVALSRAAAGLRARGTAARIQPNGG
ncbi:hypothetical protein G1H11_16815 [Phytoactinopolyspora alkaliphila]|uniref:Uncharacterized protein n=1 Tax=Phytoactinopolyspora alkaliphila TaxID=1783498 RepID=A0A6N9YPW2_9ACTN|nr:hypothetical protein [Phytoactinopolyspora alkaliphila]NED96970.1 hypothetical protein [Phytoactinopolyspora alkaliphila]